MGDEGKRKNEWDGRWAVGIARADGQLRAVMRGQDGEEVLEPLEALLSTGLPSAKSAKRMLETDFASWQKVRFDDYANAFDAPPGDVHQELWSFSSKGLQFFMPALVLMRNVSRPQLKLLPKLFAPQGLDDICSLVDGRVVFNVGLHDSRRMHARKAVVEPYQWLHSHRSARLLAASIYQHACNGRIAMQLPIGVARMTVFGVLKGDCFWTTSLTLTTVDTTESPLPHLSGQAMRRYVFSGGGRVDAVGSGLGTVNPKVPRLPLRDGFSSVSDTEWAALEPRLRQQRRTIHDRRDMLDGILEKICSGRPWRTVDFKVGNYVTAWRQHSVWLSNGKWDEVVDVISARGSKPSNAIAGPASAASARSEAQMVLDTLTDAEWSALLTECRIPNRARKYDLKAVVELILRHEVLKTPWGLNRHVGKGIAEAAQRISSKWRRTKRLSALIAAFEAVCAARG